MGLGALLQRCGGVILLGTAIAGILERALIESLELLSYCDDTLL